MSNHRIIFGDSRYMHEIENESVHLMVTSPPYWNIKDYCHSSQIGYSQKYEEYLEDISKVIKETFRILFPGCRAAINIGDQYLKAKDFERYRVQPIPADIILLSQKAGFDFMGNIIWKKISTTKTSGGGSWMGSTYFPRDGQITYEHEYIIILKKPGKAPRPTKEQKEMSKLEKAERISWFRGIWDIHPERQEGHIAMFPVEVPRRLIKMYSFFGETVIDPFSGSGTTSKAAEELGRNSIGYEINPEFKPLMEEKILSGCESSPSINFEYRQ